MANLSASKKDIRVSLRRKLRNYKTRDCVRDLSKDLLKLTQKGDKKAALELLPKVFSALDKAVKKHVLQKNNVARKKSRLSRALAKMK